MILVPRLQLTGTSGGRKGIRARRNDYVSGRDDSQPAEVEVVIIN